jgi:hypothetical protein
VQFWVKVAARTAGAKYFLKGRILAECSFEAITFHDSHDSWYTGTQTMPIGLLSQDKCLDDIENCRYRVPVSKHDQNFLIMAAVNNSIIYPPVHAVYRRVYILLCCCCCCWYCFWCCDAFNQTWYYFSRQLIKHD